MKRLLAYLGAVVLILFAMVGLLLVGLVIYYQIACVPTHSFFVC